MYVAPVGDMNQVLRIGLEEESRERIFDILGLDGWFLN